VRHLILVQGPSREAALEGAEALEAKLDQLVARKVIAGYDLATRYVPSLAEQQRRLAALPEPATLRTNLEQALAGLPFQRGVFEPFLREVEQSRARGPLGEADLRGTVLGIKLQTLVVPAGSGWAVLVPLYGVADARGARRRSSGARPQGGIRAAARRLPAGGAAPDRARHGRDHAAARLRPAQRARRAPGRAAGCACACSSAPAILQGLGQRLTVFHLIAMLLVMGIGLNYSLFFDRPEADLCCAAGCCSRSMSPCATTLLAFVTLAFSSNPVLHAIGLTVSVGAGGGLPDFRGTRAPMIRSLCPRIPRPPRSAAARRRCWRRYAAAEAG
jgi:predicted exporter